MKAVEVIILRVDGLGRPVGGGGGGAGGERGLQVAISGTVGRLVRVGGKQSPGAGGCDGHRAIYLQIVHRIGNKAMKKTVVT